MSEHLQQLPGRPFPLGASWDGNGTNFALFAEHAQKVELCLFDNEGKETKAELIERDQHVFHGYLKRIGPGQYYGYRVHVPHSPQEGMRFNPNKLLLDPYARAISGDLVWDNSLFGYQIDSEVGDMSFSESDSAPFMPKSVVVDMAYDWKGDRPPEISYNSSIIYELHVKGFSQLDSKIPEPLRGTYSGLAHPASIEYLKGLGVTAVELMPIHHFVTDRHLQEKGLQNYWGYNTIGFFAPESRYASAGTDGQQVREFRDMVRSLHSAGIEVILDVVYNHTAEGNHNGPTLSFKGIDNLTYYRLEEEDKRYYTDYTGTGNTLNTRMPAVLRFIMDSLRYWVEEMHVDGFRFDLASTLARGLHEVDRLGAFFDIIHQDPIISRVKLIAEPWDVGEGGYQVGKFPPGWAEWNGKYRDLMRRFWKGEPETLGVFAQRFLGSPDIYMEDYRRPTASINFVTAHDGFTLHDLVSYSEKHNEANGDDNQDGESDNYSWNCGTEGETRDLQIIELRSRQKRNFLATLLLSQGVPMIVSGDELGKTQKGNNNAYCQDNEISWIHWDAKEEDLIGFTTDLIRLRREHPSLRRREWIVGDKIDSDGLRDIAWFSSEGSLMEDAHWKGGMPCLGIFLHGEGIQGKTAEGKHILDHHFFLIFNAGSETVSFSLPPVEYAAEWSVVVNTESHQKLGERKKAGTIIDLARKSVLVLRAF